MKAPTQRMNPTTLAIKRYSETEKLLIETFMEQTQFVVTEQIEFEHRGESNLNSF